jgi:hypothetical protein
MNASRQLASRLRDTCKKLDLDGRRTYLKEHVNRFQTEVAPADYHFHEYTFTTDEMRTFLARHNFTVVQEAGFSSEWGLADIQLCRQLVGIGRSRRSWFNKMFGGLLRLVRYCDARDSIWTKAIAAANGELIGNLKLYVCKNRKATNGKTQEVT